MGIFELKFFSKITLPHQCFYGTVALLYQHSVFLYKPSHAPLA